MSEPINNESNNNSQNFSDSDMQNVDNSEVEIQQTTINDSSETNSDNSQTNVQEPSQSADSGAVYDNQSKEASPVDNITNSASENAPVQASVNNSNNSASLIEEKIQRKIDAVKDFAFCQKESDKVPVFPYVVALTGHRSAVITDAVRETAKNQLRSLAKTWGSASSNSFNALLNQTVYTRKYIQNNTVPLIALIGLEDGESGKIWAEIAADLRDNEKFNIKIVAVASIPFQTLFELTEKYPNRFSRPDNNIDFNIIDGLIELPAGKEIEYLLEDYKLLESFCTDEKPHTKELFNMLLSNTHIYEMQLEEYRKFLCIHSHALFAFVNNIEQIQKQWNDIYSYDLELFTSSDRNDKNISELKRQKIDKIQHELLKFEDEVKDSYRLKDLIDQVYDIRQQGSESASYQELKNEFERLANEYHHYKEPVQGNNQAEDDFSRTEEMIVYKLLGNIKAKLNPYDNPRGISFASIGPVICIHTEKETAPNNCQSDKSSSDITIIVKDQPDDDEYTITKSFPHFKNIVEFSEIRDVCKKLGLANRACLNYFNRNSYYHKKNNSTYDKSDLQNVVDEKTISLYTFSQYTRFLKSRYFQAMKKTTLLYAIVAFVLLFCFAIISAYNNMVSSNAASVPTIISIIPSILALTLIVCQVIYSLLNYHKLYHYFHALFVGLKVQLYWELAGVDEHVPEMFNLHQINEIVWLRAAFNGLFVTLPGKKKSSIISDDSDEPDDPEQQLKNYIDLQTKLLQKCRTIRDNWVDSEFDNLIGIKDSSFDKLKKSLENELEGLSQDLDNKTPTFSIDYFWGQFKNVLNWLSPFGGQLAFFIYLVPFIYFPIKNYLLKNQYFSDMNACIANCCQYTIVKVFLMVCFVALTLVSCLLIVYNAYRKASLKDLDIKRKHQLLDPFRRANLLLSIKLAHWKSALNALQTLINNSKNYKDLHLSQENHSDNVDKYSHSYIINHSYNDFKIILKELGRIKLAVCAEWYLGLKERRMKIQYNRTILR